MAKEISNKQLVEEIKRLGGKASIKEHKEDLKRKLEDLKNERFYEKYGRPTENAMENETQKCVDHIIASMTTKKEEEENMKKQNTEAQAIIATQNTENTNKEDKNMKNQNTENTAAETKNAEAEKKAPKMTAEEKEHAWADAVNKAVTGYGLTIRYSPKINRTTVLDPSNHSIMCIEHTGRSAVIRSKKDMVPEGYTYTWVECIPINPCMVRFNTIDEFNQGLAKYVAHMDAVFAVRKEKADAEKAAKEAAKKAEAEAKAAAKAEEKAKKEAARKAAKEAKAQAKAEEKARKKAEKEAATAAKAEAEKAAAEPEAKAE